MGVQGVCPRRGIIDHLSDCCSNVISFDGPVAKFFAGSGEGGADGNAAGGAESGAAGGDAGGDKSLGGVFSAPVRTDESPEIIFDVKDESGKSGGDTRPKK